MVPSKGHNPYFPICSLSEEVFWKIIGCPLTVNLHLPSMVPFKLSFHLSEEWFFFSFPVNHLIWENCIELAKINGKKRITMPRQSWLLFLSVVWERTWLLPSVSLTWIVSLLLAPFLSRSKPWWLRRWWILSTQRWWKSRILPTAVRAPVCSGRNRGHSACLLSSWRGSLRCGPTVLYSRPLCLPFHTSLA